MYTAEDVIQQGQNIYLFPFLLTTLIVLLVIAVVTVFVLDKLDITKGRIHTLATTSAFLLLVLTIITFVVEGRQTIEADIAWREDVVYPYITTLDYDEKPFVSMEEVQPVDGVSQPPVVKYQDDDYVVKIAEFPNEDASVYQTKLDIPIGETPVVRFYKLEEDLGNGFVPGVYPLTVHLNELED